MSHDPQTNITAFWSKVAPEYEAHPGNVPERDSAEYAAWIEAVRDLLPPPPADVLDIATGTGFVAVIAAALGHRVTAIDASAEMLTEARRQAAERGLEVTFEQRDAVEPGFAGETFDAIISRHFIWTLREPERAFRAWRSLLRPRGRVVVIDGFWFQQPAEDADVGVDEGPPGLFEEHYTKETRTSLPAMSASSPEPIAQMLRDAGFAEVTIGDLARVHAAAKDPPGADPWYTIVATRG